MASKNVETLRAAHESWNRRDFPAVVRNAAESLGEGLLGCPHHQPRIH